MSAGGYIVPRPRLRAVERLTEGVCPHCGLTIIHGDTVVAGMDGQAWHASCYERVVRRWKRGSRRWQR